MELVGWYVFSSLIAMLVGFGMALMVDSTRDPRIQKVLDDFRFEHEVDYEKAGWWIVNIPYAVLWLFFTLMIAAIRVGGPGVVEVTHMMQGGVPVFLGVLAYRLNFYPLWFRLKSVVKVPKEIAASYATTKKKWEELCKQGKEAEEAANQAKEAHDLAYSAMVHIWSRMILQRLESRLPELDAQASALISMRESNKRISDELSYWNDQLERCSFLQGARPSEFMPCVDRVRALVQGLSEVRQKKHLATSAELLTETQSLVDAVGEATRSSDAPKLSSPQGDETHILSCRS